jgi:hypothetical protein
MKRERERERERERKRERGGAKRFAETIAPAAVVADDDDGTKKGRVKMSYLIDEVHEPMYPVILLTHFVP